MSPLVVVCGVCGLDHASPDAFPCHDERAGDEPSPPPAISRFSQEDLDRVFEQL